jgi:hypothetical protein
MLLFIPCPGITAAPALVFPASYRPSSSPPPWSGSAVAAPCLRCIRCTVQQPLCRYLPRRPLLHTPGRAQRGDRHRQPPEGLHHRGCHARQPAPPRPTARQASNRIRRGQMGDVSTSVGRYAFSNGAAAKRSWNRFPTQRGGFCPPGTGGDINVSTAAESAAPADTAAKSAAVSATPVDTASEDGPLTSSPPSRGQSSGGALWRPVSCCCIAVQQRHDICYVQYTVPAIKATLCIEIN